MKMDLPLELHNCEIHDGVDVSDGEARLLDFRGSWTGPISGTGLVLRGDLLLSRGFHADGEVTLDGAKIQGSLRLNNATIVSPKEYALYLTTAHVGGDVMLPDFKTNKLVAVNLSSAIWHSSGLSSKVVGNPDSKL